MRYHENKIIPSFLQPISLQILLLYYYVSYNKVTMLLKADNIVSNVPCLCSALPGAGHRLAEGRDQGRHAVVDTAALVPALQDREGCKCV